jgi:hypothetical protein
MADTAHIHYKDPIDNWFRGLGYTGGGPCMVFAFKLAQRLKIIRGRFQCKNIYNMCETESYDKIL